MFCCVFGLGVEVVLLNFVMIWLFVNYDEVKVICNVVERNVICWNYFLDVGFYDCDGVCYGGVVLEFLVWIVFILLL